MYTAMAEGLRQNGESIKAILQEHELFMRNWDEPSDQIPEGKVTLWYRRYDQTCPPTDAEKIVQMVRGAQLEIFRDEGHCVVFAKTGKLACLLNEKGLRVILSQIIATLVLTVCESSA
jgi:pimeloyl-ACP methyl ester carboxylesterase